jgi:hypothetical protein
VNGQLCAVCMHVLIDSPELPAAAVTTVDGYAVCTRHVATVAGPLVEHLRQRYELPVPFSPSPWPDPWRSDPLPEPEPLPEPDPATVPDVEAPTVPKIEGAE